MKDNKTLFNRFSIRRVLKIILIVSIFCLLFPVYVNAQNLMKLGITRPIVTDTERYEGFDSFIHTYMKTYLNEVTGVNAVSNINASNMLKHRFGKEGETDEIYSGFISQLKLYVEFDILLVSELSTIIDKEDGTKYKRLKVRLLDSNADTITSFRITASENMKFINYMNQAIELIINRIREKMPRYDFIEINDKLKEKLKSNKKLDEDFPLSYFYIKDMEAEELYNEEAKLTKILNREGFPNTDISKAFLKRYQEVEYYNKALSFALGLIKGRYEAESVDVFLNTADEFYDMNMYSSSIDILNSVVVYRELKGWEVQLKLLNKMSRALIEIGDFVNAEGYIVAAEDVADTYGHIPYIFDSMYLFSLIYANIGEYDLTKSMMKEYKTKVEKVGSRLWIADYLYHYTKVYYEMSDFDKALKASEVSESLYKVLGKHKSLIELYVVRAKIYKDKKEFNKAVDEINKAIKKAIEIKDYLSIRNINNTMRLIEAESPSHRAYDKEEENKYVNLYNKYIKQLRDRAFLRSLSHYYLFLNEYDKAVNVLKKAIKISKAIDTSDYIYEDNLLLGNIYLKQNSNDDAFLSYAEALKNAEASENQEKQVQVLIKLAEVFSSRGNNDKAISTYNAVIESGKAYGFLDKVEKSYYKLSIIYKANGDNDKYIEYSRKALEIAKLLNSPMADTYNKALIDID